MTEGERREAMWQELIARGGPNDVSPRLLIELGISGRGSGHLVRRENDPRRGPGRRRRYGVGAPHWLPAMPPPPSGAYPAPPPPASSPVQAPTGGWNAVPPPPAGRSRRNWLIGCLVFVVLLVVGVASCSYVLFKSFGSAGAVIAASNGEIERFNVFSGTGGTQVTFTAARGIDEGDGPRLACQVIVPTIAGTDLANARWILVNRAGDLIASDETPCP